MENLLILLVIWILLGLAIGYLAPKLFKGERPYDLVGDLTIGVVVMILIGLADWYLIPLILPNLAPASLFLAALIEPLVVTLLVLWGIRWAKK